MKIASIAILTAIPLAVIAVVVTAPKPAFAADQACVKRQMAKGRSECVAKLKCDGITSRKEQARRCG